MFQQYPSLVLGHFWLCILLPLVGGFGYYFGRRSRRPRKIELPAKGFQESVNVLEEYYHGGVRTHPLTKIVLLVAIYLLNRDDEALAKAQQLAETIANPSHKAPAYRRAAQMLVRLAKATTAPNLLLRERPPTSARNSSAEIVSVA